VRLIDVEAARHPAHHDDSARRPAAHSAKGATAFPLHAIAEFLDALLQLFFIAHAKILSTSLRAADTDGFRGAFGARSVQRQAGGVTIVLSAAEAACSAEIVVCATEGRQRVFQCQALKAAPRRSHRGDGVVGLFQLARSQQ